MIKDHRPYYLKRLFQQWEQWYAKHFIVPQMQTVGENYFFMQPWHIKVFGDNIQIGDNAHIITAADRKVSFSSWRFDEHQGHITIGNNCLVCPGVRLDSASQITIGDNTMLAAGVYITDADWHDIYDRTRSIGTTRPVTLADNVWIGDGSTICKGVTIGENSVIGASSVVASDIPANVIAAGNPAKVVKPLDPEETLVTRANLFKDPRALAEQMDRVDRYVLHNNSTMDWLRSWLFPRRGD